MLCTWILLFTNFSTPVPLLIPLYIIMVNLCGWKYFGLYELLLFLPTIPRYIGYYPSMVVTINFLKAIIQQNKTVGAQFISSIANQLPESQAQRQEVVNHYISNMPSTLSYIGVEAIGIIGIVIIFIGLRRVAYKVLKRLPPRYLH